MSPVKTSWSCRPRTCPVLSGWCITKQANVFFFFYQNKSICFFCFLSLFLSLPLSEAKLIQHHGIDVWLNHRSSCETWSHGFTSLFRPLWKQDEKKTKHRRLRMDIWTHGTLTVNNLLVISIWKVWFSGMIVKHYIQKGALLSSLSISRPTSVSQIIMFLFGNASKHRQSRRRWWSEWTLNT